jgi:hypothetical protein
VRVSRVGKLADELCRELVVFDPAFFSGEDCARLAEQLAKVANAASTASARAAVRASACGRVLGRPAEFLARVNGSTAGAARAALAAVESLQGCPETEHAVLSGEVSLAQAAAIASAPEHEAELLGLARSGGLGAVKEAARKHVLAAIPAEQLHERQHAAKSVRHWRNDLGNVCVSAELPPELGVPYVNRLDRATDRAWRKARRENRKVSREAIAADVFAGSSAAGDTKTDVVIVADINAYRRGHAHDDEPCHIVGGGPIPVRIVREIVKDAFLKVVLHDGVNVHTIKHVGRRRPAELQTALDLGAAPDFDGAVCSEEGCGRRYGLQWDHIDPVANGGLTSYENQQPLCLPGHIEKTDCDRKAGLLNPRSRAP